jgi:hypothetical protein
LVVTEGAADEESPVAETEQADIEEGDANEGEVDYDIIMPSKPSHLDFGKSTVSEADMTMMTKLGYFKEADKGLVRFGGEDTIPEPKNDEVLEKFRIYLHQLTPTPLLGSACTSGLRASSKQG